MTVLNLLNCLIVTYGVPFAVYRGTKLADYSAFGTVLWGGLAWFVATICQMVFQATFLSEAAPVALVGGGDDPEAMAVAVAANFSIFGEVAKALIAGLCTAGGLLITLTSGRAQGGGEVRFLGVGLGWATAESLVRNLHPFWTQARGVSFEWRHLAMGLESNFRLVAVISVACLAWLYTRRSLPKALLPVVAGTAAAQLVVYPVVVAYLTDVANAGLVVLVGLAAADAVAVAVVARFAFSAYTRR